jgi:hypothetical protein
MKEQLSEFKENLGNFLMWKYKETFQQKGVEYVEILLCRAEQKLSSTSVLSITMKICHHCNVELSDYTG